MHPVSPALALCSALIGFAVTADAGGLSREELAAARKINVTKCGKCHKLYHPGDYSVADWDMWMVRMAKKSKLKPQQTSLLNRYFELQRVGVVPEEKRGR